MRSAKFEFVLKKNKAENRILNDFTLPSCKLTLTFNGHNLNNFHMGKTTFLHSCLKTIALRGGNIPLLQFLIVLSHATVDKLNIATYNTFESDAGNSTKPLEAFRVL